MVWPVACIVAAGSAPPTMAAYALPSGSKTDCICGMAGIGSPALAASR